MALVAVARGGMYPVEADSLLVASSSFCQPEKVFDLWRELQTCRGVVLGDRLERVQKLHGDPVWQGRATNPVLAGQGAVQRDYLCVNGVANQPVTSVYLVNDRVVALAVRRPPDPKADTSESQ